MFKIKKIPFRVDNLLIEMQMFFNDYQWLHLKSILLGLLVTPYKATLGGIVKVISFGGHISKQNEFLKVNEPVEIELFCNIRRSIKISGNVNIEFA